MCSWQRFFDCEMTVFCESGGPAVYCNEKNKRDVVHVSVSRPGGPAFHRVLSHEYRCESKCATNTGCDAAENMNVESDDAGAWRAGRKEEGSE